MKARLPFQITKAQRRAMNDEINRQIFENDTAFSMDNDAIVLWPCTYASALGKSDSEIDGCLYRRKLKELVLKSKSGTKMPNKL